METEKDLTPERGEQGTGGPLPTWVTITVVLTLLGLLVWNVVMNGNSGYPTSVILGGLLGAYGGAQELLKRRGGGK